MTNLYTRFAARAREKPHALALDDGRERLTYADLDRGSEAVARGLREAGIRAGDRVLVVQPLSARLYVLLGGLFRAGAVALAPDASSGWGGIRRALAQARPAAAVGPRRRLALLALMPEMRGVRRMPLATLLRQPGQHEVVAVEAEAPALLTHTSGSTGAPRLAVRSHRCLLAQDALVRRTLGLERGQVDVATLSVFALASLSAGATVLLPRGAHVEGVVQRLLGATRLTASPHLFETILREAPGALAHLSHLHTGGAPVLPGLLRRLAEAAPAAHVAAVYGSTEAEPIAHLDARALTDADLCRAASGGGLPAGELVGEVEVALLHPDGGTGAWSRATFEGARVPPTAVGEIVVSGAHVVPGYWNGAGDEAAKLDVEGTRWHRTGDLGRFDAEGRLWLYGRRAAQVRDARGTLHPLPVEGAARTVAGVRQAALVPGTRRLVYDGTARAEVVREALAWAGLEAVVPVRRVPLDRRHRAKPDYGAIARRWGLRRGA